LFASQVTAFAADTKATKLANKDMPIALMLGVTGDSLVSEFRMKSGSFPKNISMNSASCSSVGWKIKLLKMRSSYILEQRKVG
jgi:hypothetical protein